MLVSSSGTAGLTGSQTAIDLIYRKLVEISGTAGATNGTALDLIVRKLVEISGVAASGGTYLDIIGSQIVALGGLPIGPNEAMTGPYGLGFLRGVAPYIGQVTNRVAIPNMRSNTHKQFMAQTCVFLRDYVTSLKIRLPNWYDLVGTGEQGSGASITYTASIVDASNNAHQVLFGGSASAVVTNNTNVDSDAVSITGSPGDLIKLRTYGTSANKVVFTYFPNSKTIKNVGLGDTFISAASGITDETMIAGGSLPADSGALDIIFTPTAVYTSTIKSAPYIIGDSIAQGYTDTPDATGDIGAVARSIGASLAYINGGIASEHMVDWIASHTHRLALAQFCSHVIQEGFFNDIWSDGATSATLLTYSAQLRALFAALTPALTMWQCTIGPKTTTSDAWATLANQTIADATMNNNRVAFNTAVRAAGLPYLDLASAYESSLNSGKFTVVGGANTLDGIHPGPLGYQTVKNSGVILPSLFTRF